MLEKNIIFFNNSTQGKYVVESLKRDFSFGKNAKGRKE